MDTRVSIPLIFFVSALSFSSCSLGWGAPKPDSTVPSMPEYSGSSFESASGGVFSTGARPSIPNGARSLFGSGAKIPVMSGSKAPSPISEKDRALLQKALQLIESGDTAGAQKIRLDMEKKYPGRRFTKPAETSSGTTGVEK